METTTMQMVVYKSDKGTPVTDSVKVATTFGKMHKNVLKAVRHLMAQNLAASKWFFETKYTDAAGKQQPLFLMNRDGFSLLAMSLTGEKALQFKVLFIDQFDKMETTIKEIVAAQPQTPAIPQTFAQALRLAAEQAEQIDQQRKQLEAQAPKVAFAQALEIANKSIYIGELAKLIRQNGVEMGEIRLFRYLREKGYLTLTNQPTQRSLELGLMEMKTTTWTNPKSGELCQSFTTFVTIKGQEYFINKIVYQHQNQHQ